MKMLSPHFSEKEFACKCGIVNVSPPLLKKLELMRKRLGRAMSIRSGCRCPDHNKAEGGKSQSAHITTARRPCKAADVGVRGGIERFLVVEAAYDAGFKRVGPHRSFVHVDDDKGLPQKVMWLY